MTWGGSRRVGRGEGWGAEDPVCVPCVGGDAAWQGEKHGHWPPLPSPWLPPLTMRAAAFVLLVFMFLVVRCYALFICCSFRFITTWYASMSIEFRFGICLYILAKFVESNVTIRITQYPSLLFLWLLPCCSQRGLIASNCAPVLVTGAAHLTPVAQHDQLHHFVGHIKRIHKRFSIVEGD